MLVDGRFGKLCEGFVGRLFFFRRLCFVAATLPKMEKAAQAPHLKKAFAKHHIETEAKLRLEKVFAIIDKKPQGQALRRRSSASPTKVREIINEYQGSPALDAGLLAAAQAVEHYEISRYGTIRTWAKELGLSLDAVGLLYCTLRQEKKTDEALTKIAVTVVNQEAEAA